MRDTPFMPLWVSDFIGDTLDLDAKEIGAYMLLLMTMWQKGGTLPNDKKKLQRVARVGRDWPKVWASLEAYFSDDGETISNKRLTEELHKVATKRAVNAQSGARGGRAKALKYKEAGLANATVSPKQPEPEPDIKEETNVSSSDLAPVSVDETSQAVSAYNVAAGHAGWPQAKTISPQRKRSLKARLRECGGIEGWQVALRKAYQSDFCREEWRGFNLDSLISQKKFTSLMEGKYDNRSQNRTAPDRQLHRSDPAAEQILRLTGAGRTPSDGGPRTRSDGEKDGPFRMGAGSGDFGARQADEGLDFGAPRLSVVGGSGGVPRMD